MKETLYYKVVLRAEDIFSYNDGFIVIEVEDGNIINLEGIFTTDFVKSNIREEYIFPIYYESQGTKKLTENFRTIYKKVEIKNFINNPEIELPKASFISIVNENNVVEDIVEVEIIEKIEDVCKQLELKERISKFKQNNVFEE